MSNEEKAKQFQEARDKMTKQSLNEMFEVKTFADCEITCRDKVFEVNKSLFCASSEFFLNAFSINMKEKNENRIEIDRFSPKTVENMIRFMYSFDELPKLDETAEELLRAAHMYNIASLKKYCITYLSQNISLDNIISRGLFALDLNEEALLGKLTTFAAENYKELMKTDKWDEMEQSDPAKAFRFDACIKKILFKV